MHHTDHAPARSGTDPPRPQQPSARPSPIVGFFVALALALVGWGVFWLTTRDEATPDPGPDTNNVGASEGIQLTDEQATARIKELNTLADEGIEERNPSLIAETHMSSSPAATRAYETIRTLKRDDVFDRSSVRSVRMAVLSQTPEEIKIRESRVIRFCFMSENGRDVSQGPAAIQQTTIWTLRWQSDQWLIYDGVAESERVVDKSAAHCS